MTAPSTGPSTGPLPVMGAQGPVRNAGEERGKAPRKWPRRRVLVSAGVALVIAAGAAVAVTDPFAGSHKSSSGVADNAYPISYATVQRETLDSQTEVQGTLGYGATGNASATDVVMPAGTGSTTLVQDEDQVAAAKQNLASDEAAVTALLAVNSQGMTGAVQAAGADQGSLQATEKSNARALSQAEQAASADKGALSVTEKSNAHTLSQAEQAASADKAALSTAEKSNAQALAQAEQAATSDGSALQQAKKSNAQALAQAEQAVSADRAALSGTEKSDSQALAQAEQQASADNASLQVTEQSAAQALAQAETASANAASTLSSDQSQLSSDQATFTAAQQKEVVDCQGSGGAGSTGASDASGTAKSTSSAGAACSADITAVAQDQATVTADQQKVTADQDALSADQANVSVTKAKNAQAAQQAQAQLQAAEQGISATKAKNAQAAQQAQAQLQAAEQAVSATKAKNAQAAQQAGAVAQSGDQAVSGTSAKDAQSLQQAEAEVHAAQLVLSQDQANLAADRSQVSVASSPGGGGGAGGGSGSSGGGGGAGGGPGSSGGGGPSGSAGTGAAQVATYTELPQVGQVISQGQGLWAINGQPTPLLYGDITPWRAFMPGMPPGPDVAALNMDLDALGYGKELKGDSFTSATESAVTKLQAAEGTARTGQLPLGSVIFQPGAVQVTTVNPTVGQTVSAGQVVLQVTTTKRQVQVPLDATQQSDIKVGDKVSIVMPDNATTPGIVSYVSNVATTPSSGTSSSGSSTPTVEVNITPTVPAATGTLDDLSVNVWITTAVAPDAYVVPVDALVAMSNGGYALEAAGATGTHYLVPVAVGLFDDANEMVQVSGAGVRAGLKVVVPQL